MANAPVESAAPTELLFFVYVFTQGSVRAFGTLATLGFAGVSCLRHSRQHRPINPTTNANNDTAQPIQQQAQTTTPTNKHNNKRKQRHRPTNPTTSANNNTTQPIQQQAQTITPPNQSNSKRKQPHRIIIRTTNDRWGIRPIRKEPCKGDTPA